MKKKVSCELCNLAATTYCESDQASLCFHCDTKVHKANFLVTKHSRNLLCHLCQNPTPWTASGPMLPPSLSLCVSCASTTSVHAAQSHHISDEIAPQQDHHHHDTYDDDHDDDDDDNDDDDEDSSSDIDEDDEDDDDDNQVVPLTANSGSSSIETEDEDDDIEDANGDDDGSMSSSLLPSSLKRKREINCFLNPCY